MAQQGDKMILDAIIQPCIVSMQQKGMDPMVSLTLDGIEDRKIALVSKIPDSDKEVQDAG